MSRFMLQAMV